jgi:hypothetical protein
MLELAFIGAAVIGIGLFTVAEIQRYPRMILLQWGKFTNTRLGIKGHRNWTDEPDIVEYPDFKYWVRLKPNPGFNLPKIGYYSRAKGRNR